MPGPANVYLPDLMEPAGLAAMARPRKIGPAVIHVKKNDDLHLDRHARLAVGNNASSTVPLASSARHGKYCVGISGASRRFF
jgi:hypothetical protein